MLSVFAARTAVLSLDRNVHGRGMILIQIGRGIAKSAVRVRYCQQPECAVLALLERPTLLKVIGNERMEAMTFTFLLKSLGACPEAVAWRGKRDLKTTWAKCERGDWMLWLAGNMADKKGWPTRQQVVIAACDCAELALPIFEKRHPQDNRPRVAI